MSAKLSSKNFYGGNLMVNKGGKTKRVNMWSA